MSELRSADCVKAITEKFGGNASDWKRQFKKKSGDSIVRIFQNTVNGQVVRTIEQNGMLELQSDQKSNLPIKLMGASNNLAQFKSAPVTVSLLPITGTKRELAEFSGRVIYDRGDHDEPGEVDFYCGPETKDGSLWDQGHYGTDKKLEMLFNDFPPDSLEIEASECMHIMKTPPGLDDDDIWDIIESRLVKAAAVRMGD